MKFSLGNTRAFGSYNKFFIKEFPIRVAVPLDGPVPEEMAALYNTHGKQLRNVFHEIALYSGNPHSRMARCFQMVVGDTNEAIAQYRISPVLLCASYKQTYSLPKLAVFSSVLQGKSVILISQFAPPGHYNTRIPDKLAPYKKAYHTCLWQECKH